MKYRLTCDFGSGSVKAALSDETFHLIAVENAPYQTYFPKLGWAEQKPEEQWAALCRAVQQLMQRTGIQPDAVEGIAMAQTATTIIFVDEHGAPLTDCVMWMDGRAGEQAQQINEKLGENRFSGKNVISKLLWFLQNEPETVQRAAYMLDVSAFLFHRMTGQWAYEFTGSRATCLVDIEKRCWDDAMFTLIGFPRDKVPERIAASTDRIGELTEQAAQALGLAAGTPVFGGCSDHATATLGTGCIHPGDAHIYIGTSAWLVCATSAVDPHPGRMPSPVPGMRYHFYDTDSGGSCIEYLLNTYYTKEAAEGKDVFAEMDQEIRQAQQDGDQENVLFLPFLAGASAPISNMTVRASLLNLTRSTQRRHIARAVMEGICFNLRWMLDIHMQNTDGHRPAVLRAIGGGVQNPILNQMLADVLFLPIAVMKNPRFAGNLGLQTCIEIGLGTAEDFYVLDDVAVYDEIYYPDYTRHQRYNRLYKIYRNSYDALEPIYQILNGEKGADRS